MGSTQNEYSEVLKGKRNNHEAFIFCKRKINSERNCGAVAKCEVKMPDEIYKAIEKLNEDREEILTSTLKTGGEVVLNAARRNLSQAIRNSSNRSTGELKSSLGLSPVAFAPMMKEIADVAANAGGKLRGLLHSNRQG